jgi:hypothetical protein
MAELEREASRILTPLVADSKATVTLGPEEQAVVATWIFKTTLILQFAHSFNRFIPDENYAWLYRERAPIPDTHAWIGAYELRTHPVSDSTVPIYELGGYRSTVSVGAFVYQLIAFPGAGFIPIDPPDDIAPFMTRLLPATDEEIPWPAGRVMTDDDLHRISRLRADAWKTQ